MAELLDNIQTLIFKDMDLMSFVIISMFLSFIVMFWRAQATSKLNWIDLIRKPGSQVISLTKLIQLLGAMVATWIMVKMAMSDKITWDLLATYLAYVGSVEGYSKFVSAKYGSNQPKPDKKDTDAS
jgi:hypothetical protein